jgi:hypothetical protein
MRLARATAGPVTVRRWACALLVLGSCVSPTLPPDDPPAPRVELGEGRATLRGAVPEAPAFVIALNETSGLLYGQRTLTGAYAFEVELHPCDYFALWYQAGDFQSSAVHFVAADRAGRPELCDDATGVSPDPADAGSP